MRPGNAVGQRVKRLDQAVFDVQQHALSAEDVFIRWFIELAGEVIGELTALLLVRAHATHPRG